MFEIGPSILGHGAYVLLSGHSASFTWPRPRLDHGDCDMSSQQGSNNYGNGNYGGNPGVSYGGPGRQEMSYLCAGERVRNLLAGDDVMVLIFLPPSPVFSAPQIVEPRTRLGPVSPSVAGSAGIVSCTKKGLPGVRLPPCCSRDCIRPFANGHCSGTVRSAVTPYFFEVVIVFYGHPC